MKSPSPFVHWLRLGLALGAAAAPPLACNSNRDAVAGLAELSQGCLVNSDCEAPLVCAFERCHVECVTTRDCDGTARCVGALEPARVCQLLEESVCVTNVDCPASFTCGVDGHCRDVCSTVSECVGTQLCVQGVCAEPGELDDSGNLPNVLGFYGCATTSDCAPGKKCVSGACQPECLTERDCDAASLCDEGACRTPGPSLCVRTDECTSAGAQCVDGQCQCACLADADCETGETCSECACRPAPKPECDGASPCGPGKRCIDGECQCECVDARDCAEGFVCDGCACVPPTSVHDAALYYWSDVQLMRGITTVETELYMSSLRSTQGLEALQRVGQLSIESMTPSTSDPTAFAGLANLTQIDGDLSFSYVRDIELSFNPKLAVAGDVYFRHTAYSCAEVTAFFQALVGKKGSLITEDNLNCAGDCSQCPPSE